MDHAVYQRWRPRRRRRSTHPCDASPILPIARSSGWPRRARWPLLEVPGAGEPLLAGLTSIVLSSATVNVALKGLYPRERPDRVTAGVVHARQTKMPESASFPSGHSASGFAFATAVGHQIPMLSLPLACWLLLWPIHVSIPGSTIQVTQSSAR